MRCKGGLLGRLIQREEDDATDRQSGSGQEQEKVAATNKRQGVASKSPKIPTAGVHVGQPRKREK